MYDLSKTGPQQVYDGTRLRIQNLTAHAILCVLSTHQGIGSNTVKTGSAGSCGTKGDRESHALRTSKNWVLLAQRTQRPWTWTWRDCCTVSLKLLAVQIYNGRGMIGLPNLPHCTSKPGLDGMTASSNFFPGSPHPQPQQGYLSHPFPHILPRARHNRLAFPRCRRRRRSAGSR